MHQIVQDRGKGRLRILEVPDPVATAGRVVIANAASIISAGTEGAVRDLARKSLLQKARERPDQVRRVLQKLRQEGLIETVRQVRSKLDEPMPLGYSSAGVVLACGAGVQGIRPGDRVASNGPHAGVVSVPRNLCAVVPGGVGFEEAAFAVLGSIALHGIRLAQTGLGETVFVIGLGLVGQIAVALAAAAGCRVIGTDLDAARCELALRMGAVVADVGLEADRVRALTSGLGADAVLIAAGTPSDEPIALAGEVVRKKGRVVVVGAVGMNIPRRPYYDTEAELLVSCSYGPGRYDPSYEEQGHDYPAPYVRWTEQRNLAAILDLMSGGRLDVRPLISHRFTIEEAGAAYDLIDRDDEPYLGIVLRYPEAERQAPERNIDLRSVAERGRVGVGFLGVGSFGRSVLLPAFSRVTDRLDPRVLCSARGLSATDAADGVDVTRVTSDEEDVFSDPTVKAVVIATRHDLHGRQTLRAVETGRHVFVEKPLALTLREIAAIENALAAPRDGAPIVMVGYNRRFSPAAQEVRSFVKDIEGPLTASFRFNAGWISSDHWTQDEMVGGGRLIGEACHAIDLLTFLIGSPPVRVFAECIGGPSAPAVTDDQCFITLRHADGSVSSVAYLAGGDKAFPKERVEVFGGGRVAVIDDFREVISVTGGRTKRNRNLQQDKGHRQEVESFADAVARGGEAPIPWRDLRAVSVASILAVRSLREGVPFEVPGGTLDTAT